MLLALDTETSTYNNGGPFDRRNKCVCYSWACSDSKGADKIGPDSIARLNDKIAGAGTIIGFNFKFDLHWFRNNGITFDGKQIWDCQLAEFVITRQQWKYPSLDGACEKYGLPRKIDVIAEKYWKKGIQTEDIPWEELREYAEQDAVITLALYEHQQAIMTPEQKRLTRLVNMDMVVLQEMEWNGLLYDEELCERRAEEITNQISTITAELSGIYPDVPINFGSGDHLSAFLYGGTITEVVKEHIGFFKSGAQVGQPRYRNVEVNHELPRLVTPVPRSELKKAGFYATNKDTLLKLRPNRKTRSVIELIQQQVRLDTLMSKTYNGIRKSNTVQNWEPGWLHGQFNQVTAATGRLSSSGPNLQNIDGQALDLFISRYND